MHLLPTKKSDVIKGEVYLDCDCILKVKQDCGTQYFQCSASHAVRVKVIFEQLASVRYVEIIPIEDFK